MPIRQPHTRTQARAAAHASAFPGGTHSRAWAQKAPEVRGFLSIFQPSTLALTNQMLKIEYNQSQPEPLHTHNQNPM